MGKRSAIQPNHPQLNDKDLIPTNTVESKPFADDAVVGAITFKITNQTNKPISFLTHKFVVSVGGRQIPLEDYVYMKHTTFGDDFTGDRLYEVTFIPLSALDLINQKKSFIFNE